MAERRARPTPDESVSAAIVTSAVVGVLCPDREESMPLSDSSFKAKRHDDRWYRGLAFPQKLEAGSGFLRCLLARN